MPATNIITPMKLTTIPVGPFFVVKPPELAAITTPNKKITTPTISSLIQIFNSVLVIA